MALEPGAGLLEELRVARGVRPENGIYDSTGSEAEVIDVGYDAVSLGDKAPNGSQLRPHIVFFGEAVPKIEKAIDVVEACDLLLRIPIHGATSSLNMGSAASICLYEIARQRDFGGKR